MITTVEELADRLEDGWVPEGTEVIHRREELVIVELETGCELHISKEEVVEGVVVSSST